jgi:hypothetical protein
MALVNPNIAMSYRGIELPQQNALADYAAIQQIQGGRQAQELNALKMQEAQRTAKSQNVLADAYAQATDPATGKIDYNKLTGLVAAGGGGAQLPGIQKLRTEQDTASTKLLSDKLALLPNAYKMADTPEAYLALHQSVHTDPVLGPWLKSVGATPEKGLATLQNAVQTGKFDELRMGSMQSVAQLLEGMKPVVVSPGASVFQGGKSVFTAPAAPVAPAAPPTSVAEFERAKTDPAFMKFLQDRAAATRPPRPDAAPRTQQVTLSDGSLGIVNMDTGVITPSTVGGAAVKGKPSAFAEKAAAQKVQMGKDINQAIFELKDAAKTGGLIDKSTGSGAGRLYDVGAGFFGNAPEGAIAAGQLAPIADLVLKMVPRFEGPQSDKDTQSYKAAAGQLADSSLPTKIRKAAANEIIRLMEARKNQFGSADMAAPDAAGAASAPNIDALLNKYK